MSMRPTNKSKPTPFLFGRPARGPTSVTRHAVRRYIMRHRPGWQYDDAEAELKRELRGATLHECEVGSDPIWITQRGVLLVVRGDGVVATVLPMGSRPPNRRPRK